MALSSMTGFAQQTGADDGVTWQWELRSVNGKSLEVRFRDLDSLIKLKALAAALRCPPGGAGDRCLSLLDLGTGSVREPTWGPFTK